MKTAKYYMELIAIKENEIKELRAIIKDLPPQKIEGDLLYGERKKLQGEAFRLLASGETKVNVSKILNISRTTLYRIIDEDFRIRNNEKSKINMRKY